MGKIYPMDSKQTGRSDIDIEVDVALALGYVLLSDGRWLAPDADYVPQDLRGRVLDDPPPFARDLNLAFHLPLLEGEELELRHTGPHFPGDSSMAKVRSMVSARAAEAFPDYDLETTPARACCLAWLGAQRRRKPKKAR